MRNLAVITARSGSKGLKDKNIRELCGKPLIVYTIEAAIKSGVFSEVMVSTDSKAYAEVARKYGAEVPFLRSENTSTDTAGSWDVVEEVLERYEEISSRFDTVCLLQPTSPLRKASDIFFAYTLMEEKYADAVTSVCEVDHSPYWTMKLPDSLSMIDYRKKNGNGIPRQQLGTFYRLNGAIYIRKVKYDNDDIIVCSDNEYAYIMDRRDSVDIDTIDDFEYAEFLLEKERNNEK